MTISIIIATFNGAGKISNLLEGLLHQSTTEFELIIVVDGSTDNTPEVIEQYKNYFHRVKLIIQENGGRSVSRNKGAMGATGELLIFYDDDMIPANDSVKRHLDFHNHYNGIISGNPIELEDSSKTDIQNYKAWLTKKWTRKYIAEITQLSRENLFFTAANSSARRETFMLLGGFDERITDAEDFDLAYRALTANIPVYFDRDNKSVHQEYITCVSYILRLRAYGTAHNKLKLFYPERISPVKNNESNFLKRVLYRVFAFSFWPRFIDRQIVQKFLPKIVRFKFYDVVIESLASRHPSVKI